MIKQTGLFGNIPVLQPKKAVNKAAVAKVNKPKKSKKGTSSKAIRVDDIYNIIMPRYREKISKLRPNHTLELIKTSERLHDYLEAIKKNGILAYDTEASGTDEIDDEVCGLCLYTPGENPAYVPCGHDNYEHNVDVTFFVAEITRLSREGLLKIILANAKFDVRNSHNTFKMKKYIKTWWDVIMAAKFLNENLRSKALKFLWNYYVLDNKQIRVTDLDTYSKLFGNIKFNTLDPEQVYWYAAMDGLETYEVFKFQEPFLTQGEVAKSYNLNETAKLHIDETLLIEIVAEMEDIGIHMDLSLSEELSTLYTGKMNVCRKTFVEYVDDNLGTYLEELSMSNPELYSKLENPINPASPSQLGILFFDALGLKDVSRKRSTAIGIIQDLTRMYPKHKRLFDSVLEIRKYSKQLSTYVDKFPKLIKEKTGRLHGKYNIYGADTGRMSSKGPNLQNIPKYTGPRRMFAATPGYLMVGCDYSQQEPRLLSYLCGDDAMKQAYIDGKDLYSKMAHDIFGGNYTDYLKKDEAEAHGAIYNPKGEKIRDKVKAILLGIMYSKGAKAIAEDLNISVKEAKDAMALFHNTFPKVSQYEQAMKDFCVANGYVQTIRGRKRRLPDIRMPRYEITGNASDELREQIMNKLSNTWSKDAKDKLITHWRQKLGVVVKDNSGYIAQAERQVVNSIVQGSAGDMTKLAMILFARNERMKEMGGRMLLIIHDEIIIEVPRENAKEASELLEAIMIEAASMLMDVPVSCDSEIFECWEGENIEL